MRWLCTPISGIPLDRIKVIPTMALFAPLPVKTFVKLRQLSLPRILPSSARACNIKLCQLPPRPPNKTFRSSTSPASFPLSAPR